MLQGRPDCDGYVPSLRNQRVFCTGKDVRRRRVVEAACPPQGDQQQRRTASRGTRKRNLTLHVVGDLPDLVTDPVRHRSQNLVYAEEQRAKGNHVCIVDDRGISALLRAEAPCLRSRAVGSGLIELSLSAPREGEHDGGQDDGHRNDQQNRG